MPNPQTIIGQKNKNYWPKPEMLLANNFQRFGNLTRRLINKGNSTNECKRTFVGNVIFIRANIPILYCSLFYLQVAEIVVGIVFIGGIYSTMGSYFTLNNDRLRSALSVYHFGTNFMIRSITKPCVDTEACWFNDVRSHSRGKDKSHAQYLLETISYSIKRALE